MGEIMDLTKEWHRTEFFNHELTTPHRAIEKELTFYDAVANGNVEYVQKNCCEHSFSNPEGMGILSDNPIQNIRYHFVIATAMIARYCVHAGMEQEQAYSLSDFYITKMDRLNSFEKISDLHGVMSMDYCKKMDKIRKQMVISKPIILCIDYIYSHIHFRITIKELANYLNISQSYLSILFHREMGITLSQYIQKLKIEKAKNILQYSSYSIIDIANYLSFASQSHFIQVFQKITGITPHKYRTQYFRTHWDDISINIPNNK